MMLDKTSDKAYTVLCDNCGHKYGSHHVDDFCVNDDNTWNKEKLFYSTAFPELNCPSAELVGGFKATEAKPFVNGIPDNAECEGCEYYFESHGHEKYGYPCPIWDEDAEDFTGDYHPETHFHHKDYPNLAWEEYQISQVYEGMKPDKADPMYSSYSNDLPCAVCGCRKGKHGTKEPYRCLACTVGCEAFRKSIANVEAPPRELPSFKWKEISAICFESPIPAKLARLANWLAKQKKETLDFIWNNHIQENIENRLREEDRTLLSSIKPGDWAIGLVHSPHHIENVLVIGKLSKDPVFSHLPALRFARNGLLYEIEGVWLNKWGMNSLEGWSAHVVCVTILTNDMLEKAGEDFMASIPYFMGKEIFG